MSDAAKPPILFVALALGALITIPRRKGARTRPKAASGTPGPAAAGSAP